MSDLRSRDVQTAFEFVRECEASPDVAEFRRRVLNVIRLVPGMLVGYNEVDLRTGRVEAVLDPEGIAPADAEDVFPRNMHQHPVIRHHERTGDWQAYKISDFLTEEEFHALSLYSEFYAPMGVEDQIALLMPPSDRVIGVVINRGTRDFSETDRTLLNLIRPHVAVAFETVRARERARRLLGGLAYTSAAGGRSVLLVDRDGQIVDAPAHARAMLARWTGTGDRLPPGLERGPVTVERDGRRLSMRLVPARSRGEEHLVLLEEDDDPFSPGRMAAFGLSPRESDVLRLAARGGSNANIGTALGLSERTVQKHLERIMGKLGVHSRTGAVGVVLGQEPLRDFA